MQIVGCLGKLTLIGRDSVAITGISGDIHHLLLPGDIHTANFIAKIFLCIFHNSPLFLI